MCLLAASCGCELHGAKSKGSTAPDHGEERLQAEATQTEQDRVQLKTAQLEERRMCSAIQTGSRGGLLAVALSPSCRRGRDGPAAGSKSGRGAKKLNALNLEDIFKPAREA